MTQYYDGKRGNKAATDYAKGTPAQEHTRREAEDKAKFRRDRFAMLKNPYFMADALIKQLDKDNDK